MIQNNRHMSTVALVLAFASVACGGESSSTSASASAKPRGGIHPDSLKTAPVTAKPTQAAVATPATATALSTEGCPETEKGKRACSAAVFQKTWKASMSETVFPSSAKYKVTGKVVRVEITDKSKGETGDVRVYMAGDSKEVGFLFLAASKDLEAASKLAVGSEATLNCGFGGLEEIGVVTLDNCAL